MKRVPALSLITGAIFGLSALVGCEETYDDGTDTTAPAPTDTTTPPVEDTTTEDYDDTTTTPPPVIPEQEGQESYTGVLQQTTDDTGASRWMLTGTAEGDIEVDVSAVETDASALDGTRVMVTGTMSETTDAQGAIQPMLVVETIERAG